MYDEQYWKPEPLPIRRPYWKRWWFTLLTWIGSVVGICILALFLLWSAIDMGQGAEVKAYRCTPAQAEAGECLPIIGYQPGDIDKFGTYSDEYYARRWKRMCEGPARYDAMREANDRGKPMPCGR